MIRFIMAYVLGHPVTMQDDKSLDVHRAKCRSGGIFGTGDIEDYIEKTAYSLSFVV